MSAHPPCLVLHLPHWLFFFGVVGKVGVGALRHMEFLGQGSDLSCSYSNTRSLILCARPGIEPVSLDCRNTPDPIVPQQEPPASLLQSPRLVQSPLPDLSMVEAQGLVLTPFPSLLSFSRDPTSPKAVSPFTGQSNRSPALSPLPSPHPTPDSESLTSPPLNH